MSCENLFGNKTPKCDQINLQRVFLGMRIVGHSLSVDMKMTYMPRKNVLNYI